MKWPRPNQRPPRFTGRSPLAHPGILLDVPLDEWRRKEDYPCCASKRDELGRLPVGDCGPDCLRRIQRLAGR